jgi:hypothetical protein
MSGFRRAVGVAALCVLTLTIGGPAAAQQDLAAPAPAGPVVAGAARAPYMDSTAIIANPERGLFDHNGNCDANPFDEERLKELRRERNITLVRCIFYLEGYQARPLDQPVFDKLNDRAAVAKKLGLKLVLRFAYSEHTDLDANVTMVEMHIGQLAQFLQANSSVIHVLESGFVGRYGEGYYTHQKAANGSLDDSYGDRGTISVAQWKLRKRIVDKLLAVLPAARSTQVRDVRMKRRMYGPTITVVGPPANPAAARVGIHNDCLFGDHGDQGTYPQGVTDRSFLASDSKYVPIGGEICGDREPQDGQQAPAPDKIVHCAQATPELAKYRWTHLSNGQGAWTRDNWAAEGCMPLIEKSLGYRLSLAGASFPASVPRGQTFLAQVFIRNTGWAAPIANRPVELVLRKVGTTTESSRPFTGARPKTWYPGTSTLISGQFGIGRSMARGTYKLLLRLPDSDPALRTKRDVDPLDPQGTPYPYNIQLATEGAWERTTGLNELARFIQVT